MDFRLIKNHRAAVIDDWLVIADLHIGYEEVVEDRGFYVPKQSRKFFREISELQKKTGANNLVILGDLKHNIPSISVLEMEDVRNFLFSVSKIFKKIMITKGNHDGNIKLMARQKNVSVEKEFLMGDFAFVHGHSYPSEEAMMKKTILMGHMHPAVKVKDSGGGFHNYPCWIIGKLSGKKLEKYKNVGCKKAVIVPAFNPLLEGYERIIGPLAKAIKKEEVYLLDLTKVL